MRIRLSLQTERDLENRLTRTAAAVPEEADRIDREEDRGELCFVEVRTKREVIRTVRESLISTSLFYRLTRTVPAVLVDLAVPVVPADRKTADQEEELWGNEREEEMMSSVEFANKEI